MGGCAASKLGLGEEEEVVSLCRERKRLLKAAVERRYALADAHDRYIHSLNTVATAINLFVVWHSTPAPIFITLPSSSPPSSSSDPSFLKQTPSEPKTEAFVSRSSVSSSSSSSSSAPSALGVEDGGGVEGVRRREMGSGYFFAGMPPPLPPSPQRVFGWDFFNPFDGVHAAEEAAAMVGGLCRSSDEDLRAVREEEGIPELEEEVAAASVVGEGANGKWSENGNGEVVRRVVADGGLEECRGGGGGVGKEKGLTVLETPARERELLDALRDVEDHFIRAYDSGKEVSRMLEASRVHLQSGLDEIKENSSKLIQAITWHRSPSSLSSSYKSFLASSSKDTSWTERRNDLFDNYDGMQSGSHSQTLGRLYAWEKKLYEEVKAGDSTRQVYERKCSQLRNQDAKGVDSRAVDKTRSEVRDLYTRIWVAVRTAETISKRIQKLRDEELQPQLIELLQGLMKTWKVMLESHETQKQIMFEVTSFVCPSFGRFSSDSHRNVTLKLEAELQNWRTSFVSYIGAQRAYVEALDGWLSKFFMPDIEYYSRGRSSVPSYRVGAPPLLVICRDWLTSSRDLPDKAVSFAMKGFIRDMRVLWAKQGEEQQQKRRVDSLAKELDRRALELQKAENRVLESKLSELKPEPDVRLQVEYLAGRKDLIEMFKKKLDAEKVKHHECMQETQRATLNGFKTSLAKVFESLTEFSKDSLRLYDGLLMQNEKAKAAAEVAGKPSCIEDSQVGVDR